MCALEIELGREIDFIRRLLCEVHERSLANYLARAGVWGETRMKNVLAHFQPFSSREWLEDRLPSAERRSGRLLQGDHLVFLDFIEKEKALPILDMRWDLESCRPGVDLEIRFRFFLLQWRDADDRPDVVGFRLESPEGPGSHHYWHAQLITELEKDDDSLRRITGGRFPRWIPTNQPALPLPARSGPRGMGDLLAILLVSLYGLKQLNRFRDLESFAELKDRLTDMGITPPP